MSKPGSPSRCLPKRSSSLSHAALHNNIGALLKRKGAEEDAKKHFEDAIAIGTEETSQETQSNNAGSQAGLIWFHRKLLAEAQRNSSRQTAEPDRQVRVETVVERRVSFLPPENPPTGRQWGNHGRARSHSLGSAAHELSNSTIQASVGIQGSLTPANLRTPFLPPDGFNNLLPPALAVSNNNSKTNDSKRRARSYSVGITDQVSSGTIQASVGMRGSLTPAGTVTPFVPPAGLGNLAPPGLEQSNSSIMSVGSAGGAPSKRPNLVRSSSSRRGSLVPKELRRGSSIGSHIVAPVHRRGGTEGPTGTADANAATAVARKSCDDGWTPLGLEFFDEPITVSDGNNRSEDAVAAAWINLAALRYDYANSDAELEEVLQLLNNVSTETPFFAAARDVNLGVVLFRMGKTRDALLRFQTACRDLDFLIPLDDAGAAEALYLRVAALLNYARTSVRVNDAKTALKSCQTLASLTKEFSQSHPGHHGISPEIQNQVRWLSLVAKYYVMGMVHQQKGDLPKALELYTTLLNKARHDLGHDHLHVASLLFMKSMVLFEQRKLHQAMLAQLACLRIHESLPNPDVREMQKVMYAVSRTLHDREEFRDALYMYQRTLSIQKSLDSQLSIPVVMTMCNIARVHHIMGDVDAALKENEAIVKLAQEMAGGKQHPFLADRLVVLGNIYCEVGRLDKAMETFKSAVEAGGGDRVVNSSPLDVDARLAASLAKAGLQHPGAATA